jgi:GNAT superfamily N-acetyltransferase
LNTDDARDDALGEAAEPCGHCGATARLRFRFDADGGLSGLCFGGSGACPALGSGARMLRRAASGRAIGELLPAAKAVLMASEAFWTLLVEGSRDWMPGRIACLRRPWQLLLSALPMVRRERAAEAGWGESSLRLAHPTDIPQLVDLVESAYRGERSRQGWTTEADLLDGQRCDPPMLAELLRTPDSAILLIERGTEALASAHLVREGDCAWFGLFAVSPPWQRHGLGGVLLAAAELVARERWACRSLKMKVISLRSELIAWYRRRGYGPTGETAPFPYGDPRYGLPRRPDLRFIVLSKALAPRPLRRRGEKK